DVVRVDLQRRLAADLRGAVAVRRENGAARRHRLDQLQRAGFVKRRHQQCVRHRVQDGKIFRLQHDRSSQTLVQAEPIRLVQYKPLRLDQLMLREKTILAAGDNEANFALRAGPGIGANQPGEVLRRVNRADVKDETPGQVQPRAQFLLPRFGNRVAEYLRDTRI